MKETYPLAQLDSHIPSLVCLPPNTSGIADFAKKHRITHNVLPSDRSDGAEQSQMSTFIIQDKASCMPAQILYDAYKNISKKKKKIERKTDFIDACAGAVSMLVCRVVSYHVVVR